jgi:hypothetical protein
MGKCRRGANVPPVFLITKNSFLATALMRDKYKNKNIFKPLIWVVER